MKYDFAGWVTKNDTLCSDGVTIKHNAFSSNDKKRVPLVWNHSSEDPSNVLGHIELENRDNGVYGRGYFNDTDKAADALNLIRHGDINAMSIAANKIKRDGSDIIHGNIYEVSLVMAGANPGAVIEEVIQHSDKDGEGGIIYTDNVIYPSDVLDDIIKHDGLKEDLEAMDDTTKKPEPEDTKKPTEDTTEGNTVGEVYNSMTDEQKKVVSMLIAAAMESDDSEEDTTDEDTSDDKDIAHSADGGEKMRKNVFDQKGEDTVDKSKITREEANSYLQHAIKDKTSSMQDYVADQLVENGIKHGIKDIEYLFPEAKSVNNVPAFYRGGLTNADKIISSISKTPFAKVKTVFGDLTEDEARANGYIKTDEKIEEVFGLLTRTTEPQTIYKKQKLDRDDILDITDFDVVNWVLGEMRFMLNDEIARAVLVGDGRSLTDHFKIQEDKIRPIMTDDDFYTIKKSVSAGESIIDSIIRALASYEGSGTPSMYASPELIAELKLLKNTLGNYLFGDIPSESSIAARLGLKEIVPTRFMEKDKILLVNLNDYTIGANKGGELTSFDDFDIDFNQYKYLIETRISGALTQPRSAVALTLPANYFDTLDSNTPKVPEDGKNN